MKNGTNLLDQFDQLPTIEPSPEWREQLLTRIHQPGTKSHELLSRRLVYLAVVVLLAVNIFSLTRIWFIYNWLAAFSENPRNQWKKK